MTTNIERAAEVLRDDKHYKMGPHGEQFLTSEAARSLADAGLLMADAPDLPEPAYEGSTMWCVPGEHEWVTDTYKGEVMLEVDIEEAGNFGPSTVGKTWFMQRDEARALARAILAAADYAEQEQSNE